MQKCQFAVGPETERKTESPASAGDIDRQFSPAVQSPVVFKQVVVDEGKREELSAVGMSGEEEIRPRFFDIFSPDGTVVEYDAGDGVGNPHQGHRAADRPVGQSRMHVIAGVLVRYHIIQSDNLQSVNVCGLILKDMESDLPAKVLDKGGIYIRIVVPVHEKNGGLELPNRCDGFFRAVIPALDKVSSKENDVRVPVIDFPDQSFEMPPSPEMPDVEIRQLDGGYFMGEFRQIDLR